MNRETDNKESEIIGQTPSEARRQVRVTCYFGNSLQTCLPAGRRLEVNDEDEDWMEKVLWLE